MRHANSPQSPHPRPQDRPTAHTSGVHSLAFLSPILQSRKACDFVRRVTQSQTSTGCSRDRTSHSFFTMFFKTSMDRMFRLGTLTASLGIHVVSKPLLWVGLVLRESGMSIIAMAVACHCLIRYILARSPCWLRAMVILDRLTYVVRLVVTDGRLKPADNQLYHSLCHRASRYDTSQS